MTTLFSLKAILLTVPQLLPAVALSALGNHAFIEQGHCRALLHLNFVIHSRSLSQRVFVR